MLKVSLLSFCLFIFLWDRLSQISYVSPATHIQSGVKHILRYFLKFQNGFSLIVSLRCPLRNLSCINGQDTWI